MAKRLPVKDPADIVPYHIVWCDPDGTNDGGSSDDGELQGETIDTVVWTIPSGITQASSNTASIDIRGITYPINTVCTIWVSGGTAGSDYILSCKIVTSGSRTIERSIIIPVRNL